MTLLQSTVIRIKRALNITTVHKVTRAMTQVTTSWRMCMMNGIKRTVTFRVKQHTILLLMSTWTLKQKRKNLKLTLSIRKSCLPYLLTALNRMIWAIRTKSNRALKNFHKSLVICIQVFRQLLMNTTNISVHITFQHFQVFRQVRRLM